MRCILWSLLHLKRWRRKAYLLRTLIVLGEQLLFGRRELSRTFGVDFSYSGTLLVVGQGSGQLNVIDSSSWSILTAFEAHRNTVISCKFAYDDTFVLTTAG